MAGAIHNVDRGQTPVLIYAGASPFSCEGELVGTRNEWIMWLQGTLPPPSTYAVALCDSTPPTQDIPDQAAIVRQYMRFTAQINSGSTVSKYVQRALQLYVSNFFRIRCVQDKFIYIYILCIVQQASPRARCISGPGAR